MEPMFEPAAHASSRLAVFLAAAGAAVIVMLAIATDGFTRWPDTWSNIKLQSWVTQEAKDHGLEYTPDYSL